MKTLRLAVIGLGRIGKIHLDTLLGMTGSVEVVGIADPDPVQLNWGKARTSCPLFRDYKLMFKEVKADAVAICSPTTTHFEVVEHACRLGLDIFCEKPLETSLGKIEAIRQMSTDAGIQVQVGFQRRFDSNFVDLKRAVDAGQVGELHLVNITSRDPSPPPIEFVKSSGGLFMDMTIHDFDMVRFVTGDEVDTVFAQADVRVDPAIGKAGDVDTAMLMIRMKNKTLVHVDNSRKAVYGYDQRVEVFGSMGMIQSFNKTPAVHLFHDARGSHGPSPYYFFLERYEDAYREEMSRFVESLSTNKPVSVGIEDAYQATAIAMSAKRSLFEGRPVSIEEIVRDTQ